jgi:hypothetical protein
LPSFYQDPDPSPFRQSNSLGSIAFFTNFNINSHCANFVAGATGGAGVVEEKDQMNLVGQTIRIYDKNCLIKGRVSCGGEEFYGLESDKPIIGYDGLCPKCRRNHVAFIKSNQSFYTSVKSIHDKIYNERLFNEHLKGQKEVKELQTVNDSLGNIKFFTIFNFNSR